ncbi:60 kDa SS-A/Ro ribonucleoprotein [Elysia marginata]|uniref:60 kDa SS-A/Ro ribonucleoprotein n=1 Tax=Elysia marginata TaxID=1093978 RepID=A0AAV4G2Q4_9GAST|nr:60 kDa SS-A/Ro ribonucleoprotein [Elysia marginata]
MTEVSPSNLDLLARLVCTGSENGCYNALEKPDVSEEKTPCLASFVTKESGLVAVRRLRRVFNHRSFISKEPLLYCLARIIRGTLVKDSHKEDEVREDAYTLAQDICETADDLFTFVDLHKKVAEPHKGWGRGMRNLVHRWYESKSPQALANHVTRVKSGRGWTHRDVIRQCHILPGKSKAASLVVHYLVNGKKEIEKHEETSEDSEMAEVLSLLRAVEALNASSPQEKELVRALIERHKLLYRQIPSKMFQLYETYEALLCHMPTEDLFRCVPKMASIGMLDRTKEQSKLVIDHINNTQAVKDQK